MQKKDEAMTAQKPETKKDKAPAKKKDQKPGLGARISRWFREMRSELKKVSWPTAKATLKNVGTVIACVLVVGVFIWVFDWVIHAVIQALLNLL
jgi:preprotein translocase subunit SecE